MPELWNRYVPTAARAPGPRARVGGPVVDMHGHVLVREAADLVRPHLAADPRASRRLRPSAVTRWRRIWRCARRKW